MKLHEPLGDYYKHEDYPSVCLDASGWPVAAPPHVPWWKCAIWWIARNTTTRYRKWLHRDCGYDDDMEE